MKQRKRSGAIHLGYNRSIQRFRVPLPFTPVRVEVSMASDGWQVCGGSLPEINEPTIVDHGFAFEVLVTTNYCTLHWTAYPEEEE